MDHAPVDNEKRDAEVRRAPKHAAPEPMAQLQEHLPERFDTRLQDAPVGGASAKPPRQGPPNAQAQRVNVVQEAPQDEAALDALLHEEEPGMADAPPVPEQVAGGEAYAQQAYDEATCVDEVYAQQAYDEATCVDEVYAQQAYDEAAYMDEAYTQQAYDEAVYGEAMEADADAAYDEDADEDAAALPRRSVVPRARRRGRGLALTLCCLLLSLSLGVWAALSARSYRSANETTRQQVASLSAQMDSGSMVEGATLMDEISFYRSVFAALDELDAAFGARYRSCWWLIGRENAQEIGLAQAMQKRRDLEEKLASIAQKTDEAARVQQRVAGYAQALPALDGAQGVFQQDKQALSECISALEGQRDLPASLAACVSTTLDDLRAQAGQIDAYLAYVSDLAPVSKQAADFHSAVAALGAPTGAFAQDVAAYAAVVDAGGAILSKLDAVNQQAAYADFALHYSAENIGLDDADRQAIGFVPALAGAKEQLAQIAQEEERIASAVSGDDAVTVRLANLQQCKTNNQQQHDALQALALPETLQAGQHRMCEGLEKRGAYIDEGIAMLQQQQKAQSANASHATYKQQADQALSDSWLLGVKGDFAGARDKIGQSETLKGKADAQKREADAAATQAQQHEQNLPALRQAYEALLGAAPQ
nr:hypothetical protein [Maliibacterium massiliense]